MSGGNWTQSMVGAATTRPGFYANFQADAIAAAVGTGSGTVLIFSTADWGNPLTSVSDIVEFTKLAEVDTEFGVAVSSPTPAAFACKIALRAGAPLVKFGMLAVSAVKALKNLADTAAATILVLTATKYGARGNGFLVTTALNAVDSTKVDVKLYESTTLLRTWTSTVNQGAAGLAADLVTVINADVLNTYVVASSPAAGNNTLAIVTSSAFGSGASGTAVVAGTYTAALDIAEGIDFNELAFGNLTDTSIQSSVVSWLKSVRDLGKKVAVNLGGADAETDTTAKTQATTHNHEGVRYWWPGLVVDKVTYNGARVTAGYAGEIASKEPNQGLTYEQISWATDVAQRTTDAKIRAMLGAGVTVVVNSFGVPQIEQDNNTLRTYPAGKNELWSSIRIMREVDGWYNGLNTSAKKNWIGKFDNADTGQRALISVIRVYTNTLVLSGWFKPDFVIRLDEAQPSARDYMFLYYELTPIDSIKKIFGTVVIKG